MAEPDKAPDPAAALQKYTYPGAEADDAAIKKVESAIQKNCGDGFTAGLQAKAANAPITEGEVQAKKADAESQAKSEAASNPDKVKKEAQESPPGKLDSGTAVKPQIKEASPSKGGPKEPQKGKGEGPPKKPGGAGAPGKGGGEGAPKAPTALVLAAAQSGDGNIDKYLNDYSPKSAETTEKLSKIKEMSAVGKQMDAQVEGYVKNGDGAMATAKAGAINFLGKKEFEAAFGENPYAKVQGGLGTIMRGLSRFQNVVSIVGNVCGKIGMVLTVVGLLGMIFPPLGAAVSAVARVLNVIGIICDVIGFVLSAILTGLNGVVLAKQIASGASNEEKAATADLMVTEATSASSHVMSLAMSYGPGFMKGFKSASKGMIGALFSKFKSVVGKFAAKALGPIANWAKNVGYKLGIGLEKEAKVAGEGMLKKAWKLPGTALEKIRNTSFVKKVNASSFSQGAEKFAAKVDNIGWVNKVDGFGEGLGKSAGGKLEAKAGWKKSLEDSAKNDATATAQAIERNAGADAANREKATIEREIKAKRASGNEQYEQSTAGGHGVVDEGAAVRSREAYEEADRLEKNEAKAVSDAEKEGKKDARKETRDKANEEKREKRAKEEEEKTEEKRIEDFKRNPKDYDRETRGLETRRKNIEEKAKDLPEGSPERAKLEKQAAGLEKTIDQRTQIPLKASGGEIPENLWQAKKYGKEWVEGVKVGFMGAKDEKGEKLEAYNKQLEKADGHEDREKGEKAERREKIAEFHEKQGPAPTAYAQVESLLAGLDDDAGGGETTNADEHEGDEHEHEGDEPNASSNETQQNAPNETQQEPQQAAPKEEKKEEPAKQEKAETPELQYWPKLVGPGGEFAKGAQDLMRMKEVAFAFQKQQVEAKKKAMETVALLGKQGEDAGKKQDHAQTQTTSLKGTIDEATQANSAATQSGSSADQGSQEQNKGKGNSSAKGETPDPGEKPSIWHPIKRIWWYVKKWASEKAAQVFGWIQTQIANLVLEGLCGVSMGDMKAYTAALNHRMTYSKMAGTQGVAAANKAMAESQKTKSESKSYSEQAMDDAKECDANISDATNFISSVEATEQEMVAEQARAAAFLSDLKAAVDAERAKAAAEKAKKAEEAAKANSAPGPNGAPGPNAAGPKPKAAPKPKAEPKKPKPPSPAAIGKVGNAATYVVSQAGLLVQQLTSEKTAQTAALKKAVEKKPKALRQSIEGLHIGDEIVNKMKEHTTAITGAMDAAKGQTPASMGALKGLAANVKSSAKELDDAQTTAFQALNNSFKTAYQQIDAKA